MYLVRICENRGIIQEKLSEMIKVDRTTAAGYQKLEINGFIEKKEDESNKKLKTFPDRKRKNVYPFIKRK